jgi:hypothetical protein
VSPTEAEKRMYEKVSVEGPFVSPRPLILSELKAGTWGGGPWGIGVRPHEALLTAGYRGKFVLFVRLALTCKCEGTSTHKKKGEKSAREFLVAQPNAAVVVK